MKLPIRNHTSTPLTLFIEPFCDEYEIPPGGEAIVMFTHGETPSLDFHPENWVTLWSESANEAIVDVVSKEQNIVVDALFFAGMWLRHYGSQGEAAAQEIDEAVEREERASDYVRARFEAYRAFREGFRTKAIEVQPEDAALPSWSGSRTLAGAYRAGGVGAYFNYRTRLDPGLIELGAAPFDTDVARSKFNEADAIIESVNRKRQ